MAHAMRQSAAERTTVAPPEEARGFTPQSFETTGDLMGILKHTLSGVLNNEMPAKQANTVVAVSGKMLKTVELEVKTAEKSGTKRAALPLQVA